MEALKIREEQRYETDLITSGNSLSVQKWEEFHFIEFIYGLCAHKAS